MAEERRLVTILFADVTGSTALGETLDPEDVRALMAQFFTICKEVIATRGGTLEKFIGDAVMAIFGLPQAHGDDGQRARVRCERAIVVGDVNEFADAERVLEHLGDIDQLERLTVARKKASL